MTIKGKAINQNRLKGLGETFKPSKYVKKNKNTNRKKANN
jgi:hypothetical protein